MVSDRITFTIGNDRYKRVEDYVKNNKAFPNMSFFINYSIDFFMDHRHNKFISDFIYYLGFPFLAFLGLVGITLLFPTLFFYILLVIVGIYLIVLFYLFYNKYKGVKRRGYNRQRKS
jgi:hypothetical protein